MLLNRQYWPKDDDVLYHYCDAEAFMAICNYKTLRFSDLFGMNDSLEIHWGYDVWRTVATKLINSGKITHDFADKVDEAFHYSGGYGILTATCFSLEGDVLSQWRAYADDGKGFVIGFSAKELKKMKIARPLVIQYDEQAQINELEDAVYKLYQTEVTNKFTYDENFRWYCWRLYFDFAAFKNPAFQEEKEVRLLHLLKFTESNNFIKLIDEDVPDKSYTGKEIKFRMKNSTPIAFLDIEFSDNETIFPIKEVILGPKNDSLVTSISVFLETIGIPNVNVKKSLASYR